MTTASPPSPDWGAFRPRGWRRAWLGAAHSLPAWSWLRRPALWWRRPIKHAFHDAVDVEVWGLRLRLYPQGNLSEQRLLFMPQFLDMRERAILKLQLRDGDVFFDIGANIGVYSLWAASLGRRVRIESFEPDPQLCDRLRDNIKRNQLAPLTVHEMALSNASGSLRLERGAVNRGENKLADEGIMVRVETLPVVMKQLGLDRVDVIKIDVEGHETSVLQPLFERCPRAAWPRLVIAEVDRKLPQVTDAPHGRLLVGAGYRVVERTRMNAVFAQEAGHRTSVSR